MAPNQSMTHNNPFNQADWHDVPYPPGSPSDGSVSPTPSSNSSGKSVAVKGRGWTPAQSFFGALPISAVPGASPPNLLGSPMQLRFMARGTQSELCLVSSNRTSYVIKTSMYQTVISIPGSVVAVITWPSGAPGSMSEPVCNRSGQAKRMSEFIRDVSGANVKAVSVQDRTLYCFIDQSGMKITTDLNAPQPIGYVENYNGVVINAVMEGLPVEMLHFMVITTILIQGRTFVGIR